MDCKKAKSAIILVSLFFALAMIISSYFIEYKEQSKTVVFILIAVYLVPFFYQVLSLQTNPNHHNLDLDLQQ